MSGKRTRGSKKKASRGSQPQSYPRGYSKGGKFSPSVNPPDTTAHPWYPLVISAIIAPGDFTFKTLIERFQAQLNNSKLTFNATDFNSDRGTPFRVQIRFQTVTVWNLTGRIVSATIWDVEEQTTNTSDQREKDQLGAWVDCGGPQAFPCVGYHYPESYRNRVFRPDPRYADLSIVTTSGGSRDSILYHVHILWRADGAPLFQAITQPIRELEERLADLHAGLDDLTATTNEIRSSQPSTLTKVIEGVTLVASYIAPLVAEEVRSSPQLGSASAVAALVSEKGYEVI